MIEREQDAEDRLVVSRDLREFIRLSLGAGLRNCSSGGGAPDRGLLDFSNFGTAMILPGLPGSSLMKCPNACLDPANLSCVCAHLVSVAECLSIAQCCEA